MNQETPTSRRERVLVVDDAREIRNFLIQYVLKPSGFEILTASDGVEGLQLAFSEAPDLLIVDLQMPNMTGLELLERLRKLGRNIPAILITAHGSEQVAIKALRLGVKDYVIKPFVIEEMTEAVNRALRESRLLLERKNLRERLNQNNRRLQRQAQELNALYSIGKSVSSSLDLETLLQRVVEVAVYLSGADQGSLMLLNEKGDLYIRASKSADGDVRLMRERIEDVEALRVLRTKNTSILEGEQFPVHVATANKAHALAYVPLVTGERAIGVLAVANFKAETAITKRETRVLSALASYAAGTISNARLQRRIAAERHQLHTIVNQSDNPILVLDPMHHFLVVNKAARQTLGLPQGDLAGHSMPQLVENQELVSFVLQPPETGLVRHIEVQMADGRTYRATMTPLRDIGRSIVMQLLEDEGVPIEANSHALARNDVGPHF